MKYKKLIDSKFKNEILNYVNIKLPRIRKSKYDYSYYLNQFVLVLTKLSNWTSLNYVVNSNSKDYHYKSIYNEYIRWTNANIFVNAYELLLNKYYLKLKHVKKSKTINLFIDSTFILNKHGSQSVAKHYEYKKKNATKVSLIADVSKNILGVYIPPNSNTHDVKLVDLTIDNIKLKLNDIKNINLIGDKGYISKNKYNINNKYVRIITPHRKYKKKVNKNTKFEHKLLKLRYTVEHSINELKRADRLTSRKDKINITFLSFIYLRLILMLSNKIN